MVSESDQRYCVRCFTRGHEEEDCPRVQKKVESTTQFKSQREQDMAKFLKAKQSEMKNIVVEEETTKRENRFAKFVRVKRKAPEPSHRAKKPKITDSVEETPEDVEASPKISPSVSQKVMNKKPVITSDQDKDSSSESEGGGSNALANALGYGR